MPIINVNGRQVFMRLWPDGRAFFDLVRRDGQLMCANLPAILCPLAAAVIDGGDPRPLLDAIAENLHLVYCGSNNGDWRDLFAELANSYKPQPGAKPG